MWDILLEKAHAYILLVDAHRPEHFRYSRKILHYFNQRASIPYLIGLTHTDCPGAWEAEDIALSLGLLDDIENLPIININATEPASVREALLTLVEEFARGVGGYAKLNIYRHCG